MIKSDIIPIWQVLGTSTHQISKRVSEYLGIKTSHTGTLDPMAEGVIIVLGGEERLKKYEYAKWRKTYEFNLVFGISTDTYDGMGIVRDTEFLPDLYKLNKEIISQKIKKFIGPYTQEVPLFSTIKYLGKSLFEYGHLVSSSDSKRKNDKFTSKLYKLPMKTGFIYSADVLDFNILNKYQTKEYILDIIERIEKIKGNFRQEEIIRRWKEINSGLGINNRFICISKVRVQTSKGLYVRSFSQDICSSLNTIGFADKIIRIKNGKYEKKDCYKLEDIFGSDFNFNDFTSRLKS